MVQNEFLHVGNTFDLYESLSDLTGGMFVGMRTHLIVLWILCCSNGLVDSIW